MDNLILIIILIIKHQHPSLIIKHLFLSILHLSEQMLETTRAGLERIRATVVFGMVDVCSES